MRKSFFFVSIALLALPFNPAAAATIQERLAGRILLAVEQKGEAWYVNPQNFKRYYLGRPDDALVVMRSQGTGITNSDLNKIPAALTLLSGADSDNDGLPDDLESALGTNKNNSDSDGDGYLDKSELQDNFNPLGAGKLPLDLNFAAKLKGRIFLQVQAHGEAWYINPLDGKRYFLGRLANAFALMRALGLGISDSDLAKITIGSGALSDSSQNALASNSPYDLSYLEKKINDLVNAERQKNGFSALVWNSQVAAVARIQSADLAKENETLTSLDKPCDYFLIHHEGFTIGLYQDSRLKSQGIYFFNGSGENIAMQGGKEITFTSLNPDIEQRQMQECYTALDEANNELKDGLEGASLSDQQKKDLILSEVAKRSAVLAVEKPFTVVDVSWVKPDALAAEIVAGWMNSPGHRANILEKNYNASGIGAAYVNGYIIATQDFIQKVDCGFQDGICCASRACYQPTRCGQDGFCRQP